MALFGICMLVLYAPKLFGTAAFLRSRDSRGLRVATRLRRPRRAHPLGAGRADHDAGADQLGHPDPDRPRQRLERPGPRQPTGCPGRCSGASTAATCSSASCSRSPPGAISWRLLAWMSPALLGLVLAVPLSAFMGSAAAGRRLARMGLLHHPRGAHPAAARRRRRAARPRRCAPRAPGAGRARRAPVRSGGALATSRLARQRDRAPAGRARRSRSAARSLKLADGLPLERLDARETFAVLASPDTLAGLAPRRSAAAPQVKYL